jgi:hypothetical protein
MELLFISSVGGDLTIPIRSLMAEIKVTINIAHPKLIPINTIKPICDKERQQSKSTHCNEGQ